MPGKTATKADRALTVGDTRIDGAIKEEAATVLAAMGLTVSDAVRLLLMKACKASKQVDAGGGSRTHRKR